MDAAKDEESDEEEEVDTRLVQKYKTKVIDKKEDRTFEVKSDFINFIHKRKVNFTEHFATGKQDSIPLTKF